MKNMSVMAVFSLFAGGLWAQDQLADLTSKTHTSTWQGTLVDAGCGAADTTKSVENSFASNPPSAPGTTILYGLLTTDGKCIPFDQGSRERVAGLIKMKADWRENIPKIRATQVAILGTHNKDNTITVEEITISK